MPVLVGPSTARSRLSVREAITMPRNVAGARRGASATANAWRPVPARLGRRKPTRSARFRRKLTLSAQSFSAQSRTGSGRAVPAWIGRDSRAPKAEGALCSRIAGTTGWTPARAARPLARSSRTRRSSTAPTRRRRSPALAERYAAWRRRLSDALRRARPRARPRAGHRQRAAGCAARARCSALSALALAGWPDFAPLEAAPVMRDRRPGARRIPQPDDHAAGARRRQRPPHGRDRARSCRCAARPSARGSISTPRSAGGDSFGRMLQRAGVGAADAARDRRDGRAARCRSARSRPAPRSTSRSAAAPRRAQPRPLEALAFRARFDLAARGRAARRPARARSAADHGRRHPAAHSRRRRSQPLPLGARRGRAGERGAALSARARRAGRSRQRDRAADRQVRPDRRATSAPRPARSRPASCSTPGSMRDGKPRDAADALGQRRARSSKPRASASSASGLLAPVAGPDHLALRPAPPSDPRLLPDARGHRFQAPATARRSSR